ncbi:MAG TPA: TIGR03435 family protein [Vicinamibacterales bacterium]|jgi:uncharacterized protein (TIGR03435 family)|nr:TIGR03435 family protein [Vicinamibacterales bacterium]
MARMRGTWLTLGSFLLGASLLSAQTPSPSEFEVVSIKRSPSDAQSGGLRDLPDGTFVMRNQPLRSIIEAGSPVPPSEIEGFPEWVARDRYDITAKPPAGSTRRQRTAMMRRMLEDRFKLRGHVEERERPTFALVVARSDGRLGPQLKPSALDCTKPNAGCGGAFGADSIESVGLRIDDVIPFFSNLAGRTVINRTGLKGFYALTFRWSPPPAPNVAPPADDVPEFFTAIQEQLGLKLQPEKATLPVFVVDSIERPSDN